MRACVCVGCDEKIGIQRTLPLIEGGAGADVDYFYLVRVGVRVMA